MIHLKNIPLTLVYNIDVLIVDNYGHISIYAGEVRDYPVDTSLYKYCCWVDVIHVPHSINLSMLCIHSIKHSTIHMYLIKICAYIHIIKLQPVFVFEMVIAHLRLICACCFLHIFFVLLIDVSHVCDSIHKLRSSCTYTLSTDVAFFQELFLVVSDI